MSISTVRYNVNKNRLKRCCVTLLASELYRRKDAGEPLMRLGDTLKCNSCQTEISCEVGKSKKLRWGKKEASPV